MSDDPLEELKKISASEQQESRGQGEAKAQAAAAARAHEQREEAARAASAAKAPGYLRSTRSFYLMFVGLLICSGFGAAALEGEWWDWRVVSALVGAWWLAFCVVAVDGVTWKGRLPFKLVGFEAIGGKDGTGRNRVPWIAFEVVIQFVATDGARGGEPLLRTMEILATRVNRAMRADKEAQFSEKKTWRVNDDGVVKGEGTLALYTTRVLEKWLRREVRLLHRAFPVASVQVKARYTGSSFHTFDD